MFKVNTPAYLLFSSFIMICTARDLKCIYKQLFEYFLGIMQLF